ncbi:MAG: hypothetical protein JWR33_2100 [Naasia sp.]|uniref:hypothetical protein n=1 Tax=Naasia sp. TaxID=2546198 RepID=UPI0026142CB1|nr:hypothetical protein [Naasia sp.]MCU1571359.1 hypothetical protein [Naasia sp.]
MSVPAVLGGARGVRRGTILACRSGERLGSAIGRPLRFRRWQAAPAPAHLARPVRRPPGTLPDALSDRRHDEHSSAPPLAHPLADRRLTVLPS